ncbi:TolC family protein [Sphingomonas sp. AX6]|uniref:TolC family protein n=1 Tax=Sphingomonas sp. AX6 TaxID=2653171 RepID=UPI0012F2A045|nr:TolC family protein [Sphingomonas sp. AX6]VXC75539.1 Heavy metal RND efflux outer membrane protein, CzcC family [Sphingomonas sp. AX6]
MYLRCAAMLVAASCASIAQAQTLTVEQSPERSTPVFNLRQALAQAEVAAPARAEAEAGLRAAQASRTGAALRPNPRAFADVENFIGSGSYSGLGETEVTIGVELPIERGGKRSARIALANAQGITARIAAAIAIADLRAEVTQAYADAAAADQRLANAIRQREIASEGLRAAQVRVRAGRASPLEAQRAEVVRINAETDVAQQERLLSTARDNLGRLVGRPVTDALDSAWFGRIDAGASPISVRSGETLALAAAQAELTTADARVRLADAQRIPDLSISAGARHFQGSGDVAATVGVSIPLQLFNTGRAALDQARAERDRVAAQRQTALLRASNDMATAQTSVANAADRASAASGPALAAAEEAARIARIGYREGKFGQLDLLEAERTLAETRAAAIDALADYHAAQARLARLTAAVPEGFN